MHHAVLETRKPIDARATGIMVVLCLIWSFQQIAIKATVDSVTPLMQISIRSAVAALLVAALMFLRGERLSLKDGTWGAGLMVGLLFALEFLLVGEGLRYSTASHVVVFLYTSPIFAALGLQWKLPAERLRPRQWLGIALAFIGVAIAFLGKPAAIGTASAGNMLLGDFMALLAGLSWGATTVVIRTTRLSESSATLTLLYQLVGAVIVLSGAAVILRQTHFEPTPLAWGSIAFQTLVVSFASFLVWFQLLRKYLASRLSVLSFMTPIFGVVLGVILLHEPLETGFVVAAGLVLFGILLVQSAIRPPRATKRSNQRIVQSKP